MLVADLAGSTEAVVGQFLVAFPESLRRLIEHLYSLLEMKGPSGNSSPPSALRGDEEFTVLSTADEVRHSNKPAVFFFFFNVFSPLFPRHLFSPISKVEPRGRAVAHLAGSCRLCRTIVLISVSGTTQRF